MRVGGAAAATHQSQLHKVLTHGRRVVLHGWLAGTVLLVIGMLATGMANNHGAVLLMSCLVSQSIAINGILQAGLLALGRANLALLPDQILRPALVLLALAGMTTIANAGFSATVAMGVMWLSAFAATVLLVMLVSRLVPASSSVLAEQSETRHWTILGLSLMLVNASYLLAYHSDTMILGLTLAPEAIGPYQIAKQISQLGLFVMIAIQFVYGPRMSALASCHDWSGLRRLLQSIVVLGAGFAGVILGAFAVAGRWVLTLFGQEFQLAYELALILLASQLVVALVGPVGVLASMTGHHKVATVAYFGGALLMFAAGPVVVDTWGLVGAAAAQGVIAVLCASTIATFVRRRLPLLRSR